MKNYSLKIKNLTCDNCMRVLKEQLEKINLPIIDIMPGKIVLAKKPGQFQLMRIRVILRNNKMQLIVGRKQMIAEKIKGTINNLIFHKQGKTPMNYSVIISERIGINYYDLSRLFRSIEHTTIEKYIIFLRVQRIKELLIQGLTPLKIAKKLGYSSVQYLYTQFKKIEKETIRSYKKKLSPAPLLNSDLNYVYLKTLYNNLKKLYMFYFYVDKTYFTFRAETLIKKTLCYENSKIIFVYTMLFAVQHSCVWSGRRGSDKTTRIKWTGTGRSSMSLSYYRIAG